MRVGSSVVELSEPAERARACSVLLRSLPEWFGLEASIEAYESQVKELPTLAVLDGDDALGFLAFTTHTASSACGFRPLEEILGLWPDNPCLVLVKKLDLCR